MTGERLVTCAFALALLGPGACAREDDGGPPDSSVGPDSAAVPDSAATSSDGPGYDGPVEYQIVGGAPGVTVAVNGVEATSPLVVVEFDSEAAATVSELYHLETWNGDEPLDAIDIGFGACRWWCTSGPDSGCPTAPVIREVAPVDVDDAGFFRGYAEDPRAWRGVDCLRCEFAGGEESFVVCV